MGQAKHGYTVVQHWGYARERDPQFIRGLVAIELPTDAQKAMVERIGGKLFAKRHDAEMWAQRESYPVDYGGIIPIAEGTFAVESIDDLPVYIPKPPGHPY